MCGSGPFPLARILAAAREVLTNSDRYAEFSIPGVARAADVARVTVYNQFGSKAGLLEALSDELARHGGLHQLAAVITDGDPRRGSTGSWLCSPASGSPTG